VIDRRALEPDTIVGGLAVPDNRWDLVRDEVEAARARRDVSVAVVIPYFEQPRQLAILYAALERELANAPDVEVVVVDDGSACRPPAPPATLRASVLRQADFGNRTAAARNRGVRATAADVLVFLDADTIPAAGYLSTIVAWPAILPDAIVVGRRRHADLGSLDDEVALAWARSGTGDPPCAELPGPQWLADGYAASADLLHADDRSYRYVISSVMACRRALFDDVGGFDGSLREYGGDDWDLAARAFNNGAVLVHEPRAVAWHDGPDWAGRSGDGRARNGQTVRMAERITDPPGRGAGVVHRWPETVVRLRGCHDDDLVIATVASVLEAVVDVRVHVDHLGRRATGFFAHDPRVQVGAVADGVELHARTQVELTGPAVWHRGALHAALEVVRPGLTGRLTLTDAAGPVATVTATRALGRMRRAGRTDDETLARWFGATSRPAAAAGLEPLPAEVDLAACFDGTGCRTQDRAR
jgi:hypothetical protein